MHQLSFGPDRVHRSKSEKVRDLLTPDCINVSLTRFLPAGLLRKSKVQAPFGRDAIDLDTELPPLLSPDHTVIPSTRFLDDLDLGLTDFLVQDGPTSYTSDTTRHSFLPEIVDGATRSPSDRIAGLYNQEPTRSVIDFEDEDALFADFGFPQTLADQSSSQKQPTLNSSVHQPASPSSHVLEPQSFPKSKHYSCASPLPWVAEWCGQPTSQPAPPQPIYTSLTPKVFESLLRDYFQFVNPMFPVVSEREVYHLIHPEAHQARERLPKMSLALFNAIMFATSAVRFLIRQCAKCSLTCPSWPPRTRLEQLASLVSVPCVNCSIPKLRYASQRPISSYEPGMNVQLKLSSS